MTEFIAALPMYDWPEVRAEIDAHWASLRDRMRMAGIDAPEHLARRNGDMPPMPGGIRDDLGTIIAPDPASLPADEFDLPTLWRHPNLLLAQTCWGPMETTGLSSDVALVGQPSYDGYEGGAGELYSSVVVARRDLLPGLPESVAAPVDGMALLPIALLRGARLAYNEPHSMSGLLAFKRDLEAMGEGLGIFSELFQSGGHRRSIQALAEGREDVAAIDCRSWHMAKLYEPASQAVMAIGWTARRRGLPYIRSRLLPERIAKSYPPVT